MTPYLEGLTPKTVGFSDPKVGAKELSNQVIEAYQCTASPGLTSPSIRGYTRYTLHHRESLIYGINIKVTFYCLSRP